MTIADYLLAVVLAVSGGRLTIDKGLIDGLRPGDQGRLCYSVTVNENKKKLIETVGCEALEVDDLTAVVSILQPVDARPGFLVRFSISDDRTSRESLLGLGQKRLEEGKLELALTYFRRIKSSLPDDPLTNSLIQQIEKRQTEKAELQQELKRVGVYLQEAEKAIAAERFDDALAVLEKVFSVSPDNSHAALLKQALTQEVGRRKTMILIRGGTFEIGVNLPEARFYNQQPRFKTELSSFWIDTAASNQLAYSCLEAEQYCRQKGKRLPTEFELEIASRQPGFKLSINAEWTSSWYLPYPGNRRAENEYGEKYRVIRGPDDMCVRTFMLPAERSVDTSFRCACDHPPPGALLTRNN